MQKILKSSKKPTNITLSLDVLTEAKALNINISQVCDQFLRELVAKERERRWLQDNSDFIEAYNQTINSEGLPLDQWRSF
ncbi:MULTISPECIES: type II toxin-antitoxin system CcdA family antitoxin [Methylobacter]|jgi:antitoxin CcdA|uniref:type II toxin-antitoxin system CcdA family antitoxin n=1 Tax=Methylobacter TaxID=429 RepID=UPI000364F7FF|nr:MULTISPECIES: type II toxin-antitoxin system CcdA family antitoxin [Methylobacter]